VFFGLRSPFIPEHFEDSCIRVFNKKKDLFRQVFVLKSGVVPDLAKKKKGNPILSGLPFVFLSEMH
jgi:hypothetical protein